MKTTEKQLIEKLEELVEWLNQECPSVAPPLEPYRNYDLTHTFCESLRFRLDSLAALKQQIEQEWKEMTPIQRMESKGLIDHNYKSPFDEQEEKTVSDERLKCDVCGFRPSVIITTEFGTFCKEHARYK